MTDDNRLSDATDDELRARAAYFRAELEPIERELRRRRITAVKLHERCAHPDYEYETTTGPRKAFDESQPPLAEHGEPMWERNLDRGDEGWERFDHHEEAYWMRKRAKVTE